MKAEIGSSGKKEAEGRVKRESFERSFFCMVKTLRG
jgi:hypothetical protein